MKTKKILLIAGARPNFMKIAPILRVIKKDYVETINPIIVHTGQHYDFEMSETFFKDLELPKPRYFLESGSGTHAEQTAKVMIEFENICKKERPECVLVVGDVNSTLACSIVAKKLMIQVCHVEAGLRSFDLSMPEEINRMVTDSISDYFFVTEKSALDNLIQEGKPQEKIFFVGHVMIDNLLYQLEKLKKCGVKAFQYEALKKELGEYIFLTLHRPSNVDEQKKLIHITEALNTISRTIPIIFAVHPRTRKMFEKFNIILSQRIYQTPPLGYQEALSIWKNAKLVLTDSGGLQEETTALQIPCLTLRENTERPITCNIGTNRLVGSDPEKIIEHVKQILDGNQPQGQIPPKWDGRASERIVEVLYKVLNTKEERPVRETKRK